ncbi:MAG TPA: murein L,D-transpeptidase catalytic domain family protein [Cytophagaceae bacterium]|jgi:hypothetical protein
MEQKGGRLGLTEVKKVNFIIISAVLLMLQSTIVGSAIEAKKVEVVNHFESTSNDSSLDIFIKSTYSTLDLSKKDLKYEIYEKAIVGYFNIHKKFDLQKNIIAIVDFSQSSKQKRLYVIDIKNQKLLFNTLVAHGKKSGEDLAVNFSNLAESNMSSLGFYLTRNTYQGKHGLSLIIEGLDVGYNTKAVERSVVIHGADYVSEKFIQCNGRLGRSQGCPALPMDEHKEIITAIANGSVLYVHHPTYKSCHSDKLCAREVFEKQNITIKK